MDFPITEVRCLCGLQYVRADHPVTRLTCLPGMQHACKWLPHRMVGVLKDSSCFQDAERNHHTSK
jgi:hypothetical protein